jgi:hypothetical protein
MKLARSWLGFRRGARRGFPGAVPNPECTLDERVIGIGRREHWRSGCRLLQGGL